MKVLLVNGSPKHKGCTYTALSIVADELEKNGINTEIFQVGMLPIRGVYWLRHVCKKRKRTMPVR